VNRIITSGSTVKRSNTKNTPRESFKIQERKSLLPLPDEDWLDDDDDEAEGSEYEGDSVTLRDILLKAGDVTQYDLMGECLRCCATSRPEVDGCLGMQMVILSYSTSRLDGIENEQL
jgi:hypothetical protein